MSSDCIADESDDAPSYGLVEVVSLSKDVMRRRKL